MRVSRACVDLIQDMEGCELTAYLDRLADPPVWTIGYGHTGPDVYEGRTITKDEAGEILLSRLRDEFAPGVERAIAGAATTQPQFDAMVSLAYNIGVGAFERSSVARHHRNGAHLAAADAFRLWNKAGGKVWNGLVRRREAERALYLSEVPATASVTAYDREQCAREMQAALQKAGLYAGEIDGRWGRQSRAAYARFDPSHAA